MNKKIEFQVLDPNPFKCACGGILNAIKHSKKYCYDGKSAIRVTVKIVPHPKKEEDNE